MFENFFNHFKPHQTETDDLNLRYETGPIKHETEVYETEQAAKAFESNPLNQAKRYLLLYEKDSDNPEIPSPEEMNPETRRNFEILVKEFLAIQHLAQCEELNNYVWPSDSKIRETLVATLHTDRSGLYEDTLQLFYDREIDDAKKQSETRQDVPMEKRSASVNDLNEEQRAFLFDAIDDISQADPEVVTNSDPKFLEMYSDHLLKKELEAHERFTKRERGNVLSNDELERLYLKGYEQARLADRAAA